MNMRKIFAASIAAAAVACATTVSSFAGYFLGSNEAMSGMFACLLADDGANDPIFTDKAVVASINSVDVTVTVADHEFFLEEVVNNAESWYGGAFILNSNSTGWAQTEWNFNAVAGSPIVWEATGNEAEYKMTFKNADGSNFFDETDAYAQFCIHDWTATYEITITDWNAYDASGNLVASIDGAAGAADAGSDAGSAAGSETGKGSPDTGVEGIAAVAGLALVAGGAVAISRKRK